GEGIENAATAVFDGVEIRIPLLGLIDVEEELARLSKELARVGEDIGFVSRKLSNEGFVSKAPPAVVQKERDKLVAYEEEKATLQASLRELEILKG
ncbi:MAG: valine--tRNA ligase, partial [Bradymonadaceae bacterium]